MLSPDSVGICKTGFCLHHLKQLKAVYKENWETFLANSGLKIFFNLEDDFSRDYVSKLIGETEVIREVRSANESTSESQSTSRSTARCNRRAPGARFDRTSEPRGATLRFLRGGFRHEPVTTTGTNRGIQAPQNEGKGGSFNRTYRGEGRLVFWHTPALTHVGGHELVEVDDRRHVAGLVGKRTEGSSEAGTKDSPRDVTRHVAVADRRHERDDRDHCQ